MAQSIQAQTLKEVKDIRDIVTSLQHSESARVEREKATTEMYTHFQGNGKPGFLSIRDKVLSWEIKSNALLLLVIGDIIVRLIQSQP